MTRASVFYYGDGVTPSPSDPNRERHRRLLQRQAVIFGSIGLLMAITLVVALAQFSGLLPSPFAREFSTEKEADTKPSYIPVCPPEGTVPVALTDITVDVYNGTSRAGLAGSTAKSLGELGVKTGATGNFDAGYKGSAMIRVNADQIAQGYTISRLFPDSVVVLEQRDKAVIDVIVGDAYTEMSPADAIGKDPFAMPEGCQPPGDSAEDEAPAEDAEG